ncbi:SDR family NAD(P)-dependent oxidoreductase [Lysinibacter sp. HNR]|uniref:SDR family oxidoreductase n=1 Tax=Lysinibacter sp. HNR TaxID=3031408 RepID=UPI0024357906|nr:SDR family NAD(P)-dependent oxidoreductase [Lysinibacter sp. HNR]WGD37688.1 SDR family NAD(P)-dependent oxidoreductase [Lysinibacter sp. HNR]
MNILVVGASSGLGRAIVEGLLSDGRSVTGVSRRRPEDLNTPWIEADFSSPAAAAATLGEQGPGQIDTLIWNLGVWEPTAFTEEYNFGTENNETTERLIATNITGLILAVRTLLPNLLESSAPRLIITGSTSALPRNGRPEVAFGASKTALNGIADALREGYREQELRVTALQLGYLNTEDGLDIPREEAASRGAGALVPVHDVVDVIRMLLGLSPASFVRELVMPAVLDERF